MAFSSFLKLLSQNPLQHFLQNARSTLQILQIHARSITSPLFCRSSFPSCLLLALSRLPNPCISSSYVDSIFSQIEKPNSFIYNTVIRLYSKTSNPHVSIRFFVQMKKNGVETDNYTYPFVLKACNLVSDGELVILIHGEVLKAGLDSDLFITNGLISSYCRRGNVSLARDVFDRSLCRDLVSWNSMMSGYVDCGELGEAQKLFDEMPNRDAFSWAVLINGYGKKAGNVDRARELFDKSSYERDLVCWNSMIDGYSGIGDMGSARELFVVMPERNVVSWSIMIDGYVRHGNPKEALGLFYWMLQQGTKPDRVCAVGAITACAQLGALDQGQWIHSYLKRSKISLDVVVETSLVDMYMKCGSLDLARRLFEGMRKKTVVSWNVMIVGLGTNGRGEEAVELFYQMEKEGALMDDLTLLAVLSACVHGGLVDEGLNIFDRMSELGIDPKVEHYGCMVDLLGRAGRMEEARNLIETMPMAPTPTLWGSLLAACRTHGSVSLAEQVVDELARVGADDSGVYVLLSNIYADEGMWDDVWRLRKLISERGMRKEIGKSAIEVDGTVHEFVNGDWSHFRTEEIYARLRSLSNEMASIR